MRSLFLKISVAVIALLGPMLFSSAMVLADCNATDSGSALACGSDNTAGVPDSANPTNTINSTITSVINVLSVGVGIVSVVMLVIGAFRYVTSSGDSNKVASAKSTILYAIIGLVIVATAESIAQFVLQKAAVATKAK